MKKLEWMSVMKKNASFVSVVALPLEQSCEKGEEMFIVYTIVG